MSSFTAIVYILPPEVVRFVRCTMGLLSLKSTASELSRPQNIIQELHETQHKYLCVCVCVCVSVVGVPLLLFIHICITSFPSAMCHANLHHTSIIEEVRLSKLGKWSNLGAVKSLGLYLFVLLFSFIILSRLRVSRKESHRCPRPGARRLNSVSASANYRLYTSQRSIHIYIRCSSQRGSFFFLLSLSVTLHVLMDLLFNIQSLSLQKSDTFLACPLIADIRPK